MKEKIIEYLITATLIIGIVLVICIAIMFPNTYVEENKHECTTFIKYKEHYQITPMTWYYRDSFKCIECGKDYKD